MSEDSQNLAATNAAEMQKKQEDQPEIPSWVPGNIPDEKKKEFVEAVKKAYESDNTQFDFDGRTYKITEKAELKEAKWKVTFVHKHAAGDKKHEYVVSAPHQNAADRKAMVAHREKHPTGNFHMWNSEELYEEGLKGDQHKLDVDGDGKIEADDLAALRAGEKVEESHIENETETPGQTQYPGSEMPAPEGDEEEEENDEGLEESVRLKKSQDMLKVAHGAMSRDEYKKKWAHLKKPKNKLAGPGGLYKSLVKEAEENPTDKLTIDVPAMIRALEKSREDFKTDADIHNFVQALLKKKEQEITTADLPGEPVKEALDPKDDAGVWISDFINSTNPKFDGKSKEERTQMALAAWYAARRDAGINEGVLSENIAGDTRATTLTSSANLLSGVANGYDHTKDKTMPPSHAAHQSLKLHDAAARAHQQAADHYRVYAHHAGNSTLKHVAGIHHKFHSDMAQHHTLAGAGLSMGESVNEGAPADAKGGPEVMDVATKKMKDDADKNVKAEEAPYTNKADGSEEIIPAEKPKANPSPMATLKSVAKAYSEMVNI